MIRTTLFSALAAFAFSCGGSPATPKTPTGPTAGKVDLSIASVTLADDCGAKPAQGPVSSAKPGPAGRRPSMDEASLVGSVAYGDRACEQSSIQLRVANGTESSSTITIKKVELLNESGDVLRELAPRDASQWASDTYQPWDQQIGANQVLQVSYALSAPSVLPGGTYTLRVTIAEGEAERTLEKTTTLQAEASLPPGAVT